MRSLEQCRDEVFRRGKEKIRQRRRRTVGILAACVPLVAGLLLLQIPKEDNKAPENISMQQMSVSDPGDADGFTAGSGNPEFKEECVPMETMDADRGMDFGYIADEEPEVQTVTVTLEDGTEKTYFLQGTTLTDRETGEVIELSAKQLEELKEYLESQEELP